jgi:hypothetical protein
MSGTLRTSLVALLLVAAPVAARPPGDPLQHVTLPYPAKTPIVVQVNGVEAARGRLTKVLTAAMPNEAARITKQIDAGVAEALGGRKLTAVPKDGRLFFVVQDIAKLTENEPALAAFVPVTGYKAFRESFLTAEELKTYEKGADGVDAVKTSATGNETTVYMVDLKEYVALTIDKGTADTYAGKFTKATTASLGTELAGTFLNSDACVFVNMDAINEQYGEQIRGFKGLIDFAFGQAGMGGQIPGLTKKQLEGMKGILAGVFQGVEDCRGLVMGVEFRPEGINGRLQMRFAPDSVTGGTIKAEPANAMADLATFPRGLTTYSGSKLGKKFTDVLKLMAAEFQAADDDEAGAEAIDKLLADVAKAGPGVEFSASDPPHASMTMTTYTDATKAAAAITKLYKNMPANGRISTMVLKEKPVVTENARQHTGFKFAEVKLAFDFEATVASLPEQVRESTTAALKRVAKERTTMWVGTDGKAVVSVTAKDWDAASALLEDKLGGKAAVGGVDGFKATRKNLPAAANMLSLSETSQMIIGLVEQAKSVGEAIPGGGFPAIGGVKAVKGEPTFVGFAVVFKGDTATVDGFLPVAALGVAHKMLLPLFRNIE